MNTKKIIFGGVVAFLAAVLVTLPAQAQQGGALGVAIEEVIVTAQRRTESLQDVPISVRAFTGENLDELGIRSAEEIMQHVPNAGILPQGGAKTNYFIRGVGTADFHLNVVGAVGVYLDDVALNSPFAVAFSTFDMQRVEVLRGPQNTLFGRNTTGGAVNYISRKPALAEGTNGYIEAGYGRFDQFDLEGGVGFALGDKAAARLAVVSNIRDGAFTNQTLAKDTGNYQRQAGRGQILWEPNDAWELLLNVHGGISRSNTDPFKNVGFQDPADVTAPCAVRRANIIPQNNPNCVDSSGFNHQFQDWDETFGNLEHKENVDLWGGSLRVSRDLGRFTVTSVSAYDFLKVQYNEDSDGGPNAVFQFYQEGEYDQWSQELRVQSADDERLRWIAGFYWFFEEGLYQTSVRRTPGPFVPAGLNRFNVIPNTRVDQDNEVFSLYGQVEYDLHSSLTATVGLRWTHETKKGYNHPSVRCVGTVGTPRPCPAVGANFFPGLDEIRTLPALRLEPTEKLNFSSNDWGARFALDWQMTEAALLYASVSRGFKGGGFSLAALQALTGNAADSVAPEILWAYELGAKSTWADNTLQLNISGFYYDWSNLQSFQVVAATGTPRLLNVPEASLLGAELEMQWVPAAGWFVSAGLGLLHGEIDKPGAIAGVRAGNNLPNTADITFNGLLRKEIVMAQGTLAVQTSWRYKDKVTYDLANNPDLSQQEGIWTLNARGSYRFGQAERYELAVWGKNLTGEEYCRGATSLAGLSESNLCLGNLSEPTYGVSVSASFQ